MGFPIRKSADQRVLSPPHGLSQSATSFIASYRQGIHQTPLLRLIRSRRRKTKSGNAPDIGAPFVCPTRRPSVQTSAPPRPCGPFGASLRPSGTIVVPTDLYSWIRFILIRCWISPTPRSVHRLGKTAFACPPHCLHHPEANPHITQTRRTPPPPHAGAANKSVSCFSLFTMSKTIKVQTNIKRHAQPNPGGSTLIRPGGSMPVAERRQSKDPTRHAKRREADFGGSRRT